KDYFEDSSLERKNEDTSSEPTSFEIKKPVETLEQFIPSGARVIPMKYVLSPVSGIRHFDYNKNGLFRIIEMNPGFLKDYFDYFYFSDDIEFTERY
ncbi:hypothetical protein JQ310_19495, partial [Leptospira interrogans]|nr:hypothetical protein [Leptospira interrogans]